MFVYYMIHVILEDAWGGKIESVEYNFTQYRYFHRKFEYYIVKQNDTTPPLNRLEFSWYGGQLSQAPTTTMIPVYYLNFEENDLVMQASWNCHLI